MGMVEINTMIFYGMVKNLKTSQNSNFVMFLRYLKKEVRDGVDFFASR